MPDEPIWPAPSTGGGGNSFPTWIDICNPPSGIPTTAQGADPTASIQAALNYFNTNNINGRIYWSKPPGTIAAAATSGSGSIGGNAYTYNGQILVPARTFAQGGITVTIMGLCPMPNMFYGGVGYPESSGGSELISSLATAGASVFDAIPGDDPISVPMTAIRLIFEDCAVRTPSNPQCNGIDGNNLVGLEFRGECRVDTTAAGTTWVSLTGTGFGVRFPPLRNGGMARVAGTLEVIGYPTCVISTEHLTADLLALSLGLVGWAPGPGGMAHSQHVRRLVSQGCQDVIKPLGTTQIKVDQLDYGDVTPYTLLRVINDPNNWLYGEITPYPYQSQTPVGFPSIGGVNLKINPFNRPKSDWPSDDFTRYPGASTAVSGTSSNTHHPWNITFGSFSVAGGVLKSSSGGTSVQEWTYAAGGKAAPSRTIHVSLTTGTAGYAPFAGFSYVLAGGNAANHLYVKLAGGLVQLIKNVSGTDTVVAQSAAATVAASTQYSVDIVVANPTIGAYTVQVFINGVTVLSSLQDAPSGSLAGGVFTLAAALVTALTDTDQVRTKDTIGVIGADSTSSFALCRVSAA